MTGKSMIGALLCAAAIILFVFAIGWVDLLVAAQPVHAKAQEPVPDCVAIGKAGASVVSRCEDIDMGKVCYVTTGGFMFCLDE